MENAIATRLEDYTKEQLSTIIRGEAADIQAWENRGTKASVARTLVPKLHRLADITRTPYWSTAAWKLEEAYDEWDIERIDAIAKKICEVI